MNDHMDHGLGSNAFHSSTTTENISDEISMATDRKFPLPSIFLFRVSLSSHIPPSYFPLHISSFSFPGLANP
jgi:hypothetical protein